MQTSKLIGKLYVTAYKEQYALVDYSGLSLLTCKFTITHLSVVVVITVTHVHVPLSSTTQGTSRVSKLRVLKTLEYRVK